MTQNAYHYYKKQMCRQKEEQKRRRVEKPMNPSKEMVKLALKP